MEDSGFLFEGVPPRVTVEEIVKSASFPPEGLPISLMKEPRRHSGDYLETLHSWGDLPEVLRVEDAAALFAYMCGQNEMALNKVIRRAVEDGEVPFFGWHAEERWQPNYLRIIQKLIPLEKIETGNPEDSGFRCVLEPVGTHWAAMGVRPCDVVSLLVKRKRKVPERLLELLQSDSNPNPQLLPTVAEGSGAPEQGRRTAIPAQRAQEMLILEKIAELGLDARRLPKARSGRPGVKAEIRAALKGVPEFKGTRIFDKAWERLSATDEIRYASPKLGDGGLLQGDT